MKAKKKRRNYDLLDKDPKNWKGVFYYNPADSRIFVPKKYKYRGYTLNFGNLFTYLIILGFILFWVMLNYMRTW
ncbi:MAG: hypothetical protein JW857_09075 [Bacteroidales bacterium]|nr:hypothetical protein [Bacteroidales bacterium]